MEDSDFKIAVIGLGIIGGSMAYALRGFHGAHIAGCDTNAETRRKAVEKGAVDAVFDNTADAVRDASLVVFCVYPELMPKLIFENRENFKRGAVITDVCGVKSALTKKVLEVLPEECEYIGGHPMAGRETDGFDSASPELFGMCGYIITPTEKSTPSGISLVHEMAAYIGATAITESTPEEHDGIIAYTSDLMHIAAAALCLDFNSGMNRAYTAGAFRDCTRIANINPELWSGLFLENRDNVLCEIERLQNSVERLRAAIENRDRDKLKKLLTEVRDNKLEMQKRMP